MLKTAYFTPGWNFVPFFKAGVKFHPVCYMQPIKRFLKRPKWVHPGANFTPGWHNACKLPLSAPLTGGSI